MRVWARCGLGALALLALAGCETEIRVDYEGYRCDLGDLCPAGYACLAGFCTAAQPGCPGGACGSDGGPACREAGCTTPPAPGCADSTTLRKYQSQGACQADGGCSYSSSDIPCNFGCEAGQCKEQDLCAKVVCDQPPAPSCVSGKVRTFSAAGSCEKGTGVCHYGFSDAACNGSCVGGLCVPVGLSFQQTGPKVRHPVSAVDQAPGSDGKHVLAVGPGGKVSKWNGGSWSLLPSGTSADLNAVWLSASNSGWVVGDNKIVLRYNGVSLTPAGPPQGPANAKLIGVHGRTDAHVLVADDSGNYWRYDGSAWSSGGLSGGDGPYKMASVLVGGDEVERIGGRCGNATSSSCVATALSGSGSWFVDKDGTSSDGFAALGPSLSQGVAFAGRSTSPTVRRHDSSAGDFDSLGVPPNLSGSLVAGIAGAGGTGSPVYLLTGGLGGRLYRYTLNGFDPAGPLLELARPAGQSLSRNESFGVIVSESGPRSATILRRGAIASQVLDLGESWRAVAHGPSGELQLISRGALAIRAGSSFTFRKSPGASLNGLAAASQFSLLVGDGGEAYRYAGGSFQPLGASTSANLNAACRASDSELYAVGDSGVIRSYGGSGSQMSLISSPSGAQLLALHCPAPESAVACGAGGTVLRLSGGAWSLLPPLSNPATLTSCFLGSDGAVWVAGDGVFARFQAGRWTSLPARPKLTALQAFGPAEVYAIADGAEVARFDGTGWISKLSLPNALVAGASVSGRVAFVGNHGAVVEGQ